MQQMDGGFLTECSVIYKHDYVEGEEEDQQNLFRAHFVKMSEHSWFDHCNLLMNTVA